MKKRRRDLTEVFVIFKLQPHIEVFKMDSARDLLEPVKSIGNLVVFIGYRRCLAVNADKFASIQANCIYYIRSTDLSIQICKFHQDRKEESVSQGIDSLHQITQYYAHPPYSLVQLFSSYTINVRESQLFYARMTEGMSGVRTDGVKVPYHLEDLASMVESMTSSN